MVVHRLRAMYESLPYGMRALLGPIARQLPVRIRYGRAFDEERKLIRALKEGTTSREAVEQTRLEGVVASALRTNFWRDRLGRAGVTSPDGITPASLESMPLLDKETVRDSLDSMIDPKFPADRKKYVTTGGSTGQPLRIWIDKDASARDWAHVMDAWASLGYSLDEKRVILRGVRLGGGSTRSLFAYEPIRRELYVSVFDLTAERLPEVRERIARFGARYLHGYPSALELLGKSYAEAGLAPPVIEGVFAVSENLYPGQRERIEKLFKAPVLSFYGMTEKVGFAAECSCRSGYHVHGEYGYLELVDSDGAVIREPGVRGEIVATGLISTCVPLLRYRTGDYAEWTSEPCECGRPGWRLMNIVGRWAREFLVTSQDSKVYISALNLHSDVFDHVRRYQFVQDTPGRVRLMVVPDGMYSRIDRERITAELDDKLRGLIDLEVMEVDDLELTQRGKGIFIDQRLGDAEGDA